MNKSHPCIFTKVKFFMFSAVYITDFNDWEKCALSIKTLRVFHSNSSLPIYILGLGKLNDITKEKIEQVKDLNVTYVDVQSVLDKLFPFFKKFGKSNVVLVPTGGKYPLHEFSRLVIPYVNELHQYSKVLYLDNDMVVCDYLDKLFEECNEQCLNVVYSGRSCSMDNKNVIELYKDYDFWNTAYEYTCDSPLLFNMDMNFRKKYDEFIEHVNSAEEKYFLRKNEFFCSQEAVSLYG